MTGAGWALLCRPWICLLGWNMVGFSVQGGVSWEALKAHAESQVLQQQLHSSICGFCHTSVVRPGQSRSVLQGLEGLCLARRGAAVTQLWLQPGQGFAKARGTACSLSADAGLRCGSCPSLDTHKERSVGQCKSPVELKQVQDLPFSLERTGQSPEMRPCCGNQQLAQPCAGHSRSRFAGHACSGLQPESLKYP